MQISLLNDIPNSYRVKAPLSENTTFCTEIKGQQYVISNDGPIESVQYIGSHMRKPAERDLLSF